MALAVASVGHFEAAAPAAARAASGRDRDILWSEVLRYIVAAGAYDQTEALLSAHVASGGDQLLVELSASQRQAASLALPGTVAADVFTDIEARGDRNVRLRAWEEAIAALARAGRASDLQVAVERAEAERRGAGIVAAGHALARAGRTAEGIALLNRIDDRYDRDRELEILDFSAQLGTGIEAILTWSAAQPPTKEHFLQIVRLRAIARLAGDHRTAGLLDAELLRIAALVPEVDPDILSSLRSPFGR